MTDEIVPLERDVFRRHRVEGRNLVVLRQPILVWADRSAALHILVISAGFNEQNGMAGLSKPRRHHAAARAGSHDDKLVTARFSAHECRPFPKANRRLRLTDLCRMR